MKKEMTLLASLTLLLSLGFSLNTNKDIKVDAATEAPAWGLIGSSGELGSWNLGNIKLFSYQGNNTYTCQVNLNTNDEFKAYKVNDQGNFDWSNTSLLYTGKICDDVRFSFTGQNIKYSGEASEFIFTIHDDMWESISDINANTYQVRVHDGEEVVDQFSLEEHKKINDLGFRFKKDNYFRGYYTSKELNKMFIFGNAITGDTDLYINYQSVGNDKDKIIFTNDKDITMLHAWSNAHKNQSTDWNKPLVFFHRANYSACLIPVELEAENVILRTDTKQSIDIHLGQDGICSIRNEAYYINVDDTYNNKFNAYLHKDNTIGLNTFLDEFRKVRNENGYLANKTDNQVGICDISNDSPLISKYNALDPYVKTLFDDIKDFENYSINDTMNYILSRLDSNPNQVVVNYNDIIPVIVIVLISSVSFITLFVIKHKKMAR